MASCTSHHFKEKNMSFRDYFNNQPHHHRQDDRQASSSWVNELDSDYKRRKALEIIEFNKRVTTYTFCCNYCHRKFHSAQALGGHQNAHKRERSATVSALTAISYNKHRHGNGHHHRTLSSMSSLSLLSSSPLPEGIQTQSTVQRPTSSLLPWYSSRCSSHQRVNRELHPLQQRAQLFDSAGLVNRSEGASNCYVAGSSQMPPNEGTSVLDLSLKL